MFKPWLQYIEIDGTKIPYPNNFTLQKIPHIVNEMTTLTGKTVADINGWKYADTELSWDTLLDEDLQNLLTVLQFDTFQISFYDLDGTEQTINAVLKGRANVKTPMFYKGATVWKDVSVSLSFPDCYGGE